MDLQVKASGKSKTHYGLALSPDFDAQGTFLHICSVFLVSKRGGAEIPKILRKDFAPLCPCCDYYLTMVALVIKDLLASAGEVGDPGSMPGSGRSPGEGNGNLLQYSCLGNSMDGRAWQAAVHEVTKKSDTT